MVGLSGRRSNEGNIVPEHISSRTETVDISVRFYQPFSFAEVVSVASIPCLAREHDWRQQCQWWTPMFAVDQVKETYSLPV